MTFKLKPGSNEAIAQGCKCPRQKNNDIGAISKMPDDGVVNYYTRNDCPLHGEKIKHENNT